MRGGPGKGGAAAVLCGVQHLCPSQTQGGQSPEAYVSGAEGQKDRAGRLPCVLLSWGLLGAMCLLLPLLPWSESLCWRVFGTTVCRAEGGCS